MELEEDAHHERGKALLQRLHRQALNEAGAALSSARRVADEQAARIAKLVPGALAAGLSASEIAERVGLSRQRIYELRSSPPPGQGVEQRILGLLATEGALTGPAIAGRLDEAGGTVQSRLEALKSGGLVREAVARYADGTEPTVYFGLTAEGEAALEQQFWNGLRGGDAPRFAVYAPLEAAAVDAVVPHAAKVFGEEGFAVVSPGTVSGQPLPELAFRVAAATPDEAVARGRERLGELLALAGMEDRPAVIAAIAPADPVRPRR